MSLLDSWASSRALQVLLERIPEPALIFDRQGRLSFANGVALRLLGCEPGTPVTELSALLGSAAVAWLRKATVGPPPLEPLPAGRTADGTALKLVWQRLDANHGVLCVERAGTGLLPDAAATRPAEPEVAAVGWPAPAAEPTARAFGWSSPLPQLMLDERFGIQGGNAAFQAWFGAPAEALLGQDLLDLLPQVEAAAARARRTQQLQGNTSAPATAPGWSEPLLCLSAADGKPRWFRLHHEAVRDAQGQKACQLLILDRTAEHLARERAERAVHELGDWFELSPMGMLIFEPSGLIIRANRLFLEWAGERYGFIRELRSEFQALLAWGEAGVLGALSPNDPHLVRDAWVQTGAGLGAWRRLRVRLRAFLSPGRAQRYMAVLEDCTLEEERDLAQIQVATLMEAAGVGLATHSEWAGWVPVRGPQEAGRPSRPGLLGARAQPDAAVESIQRDWLEPSSLADYERLQHALRQAERAEVRLALRHPERGQRWLLSRVEPGITPSGRRLTSVITLDVTQQQFTLQRSEELLQELSAILEASPAGIAHVRDGVVMRCNQRFASMFSPPEGLQAGQAQGQMLSQILGQAPAGALWWEQCQQALASEALYQSELVWPTREGGPTGATEEPEHRWYHLSVRRAQESAAAFGDTADVRNLIVVASDITRLQAQQVALSAASQERERMAQQQRAILDSVLVGIVTVGPQGIEWMNRSARRMFSGQLSDFRHQALNTVAPPDEPSHPFAQIPFALSGTFECQVQARDGRRFWVVGNAVCTPAADGSEAWTFALLDIERRRQAEARTAEAQSSLARLMAVAPMAIVLLDGASLGVMQINAVAAELVGHAVSDIVDKPLPALLPAASSMLEADLRTALLSPQVTRREYRFEHQGQSRIWDARFQPLGAATSPSSQLLMVASDVTEQRVAQEAKLEAAIRQRDMLVKEVHHRIKNNLQGVAGLMQQIAQRRPEVASIIAEVVGQVQAIAQVYGLQVGGSGPLGVKRVVEAITGSVQRTFGRPIDLALRSAADAQWALPEAESIPIALTLNELLTNAVKHSPAPAPIECSVEASESGVVLTICNEGRLPEGFQLAQVPGGVSGLGLVRALLPRRSARLTLEAVQGRVQAQVHLHPPCVARADASHAQTAA